ncbi:MAG: chromosomal replication initiator protein DnaA [Actinomycetota bacterium]
MTPQQLWQATLGELELILSKANFTAWFKRTGVSSYDGEKVVIAAPNNFTKEWLEKKYHQAIIKALRSVTNNQVREVIYKTEILPNKPLGFSAISEEIAEIKNVVEQIAESKADEQFEARVANTQLGNVIINPKYTFSTFIVGKNNELAHAAALAVSKNPGKTYNPLFIYGGVGLGKTHLLQAVSNKILFDNPKANVLYVTCEKFVNDFISSVQNSKGGDFTKKYRSIDILLIDDIQFISGKEQSQEAFFHTFNELHQQNKQVVISSDRPPKAIATLEHRLTSRFEWGMIADVQPPDLETRIAILNAKAREKNFPLAPEISAYLANVIHNNIRELEGAINRIMAHSQLQNKELGLEEIKQITDAIIANSQTKSLTPKHIINIVAEYFDIKIEDIIGPCRKKNLTEPRQIIMYIMREEMRSSYPTIGQVLGGRDHTTVIYAYEKIQKNLKVDDKLRQDINTLKQKIYS